MMQSSTTEPFTREALKDSIQSGALQHIAIIMDGNRRWAKNRGLPSPQGHYEGYRTLRNIVEYCSDELNLPALTVYAFSTENWRRSNQEVDFLMKLFHQTLQKEVAELVLKNVRLRFLGNLESFSPAFQEECQKAEAATASNTGMLYQVALNYGGRAELVQAFQRIAKEVREGRLDPDAITEDLISQNLYTDSNIDPDMVIRTGGEYRLSNFLLWQAAYAEIYIADELWPEFTPEVLNRAIMEFQRRQRRFGK